MVMRGFPRPKLGPLLQKGSGSDTLVAKASLREIADAITDHRYQPAVDMGQGLVLKETVTISL